MGRLTKERIEELRHLSVLEHCDRHELATLAGVLRERTFRADQVLCRAGDCADEVWFVRRGNLGVRMQGSVVETVGAGDIAGELGVLGGTGRSADLVALDDGSVYVTSATSLRWVMAECPGLRRAVTPLLAERTAANEARCGV